MVEEDYHNQKKLILFYHDTKFHESSDGLFC